MAVRTKREVRQPELPFDETGATDGERMFIDEYMANGFNGLEAYLKVWPKSKRSTAKSESSRLLGRDRVQEYLSRQLAILAAGQEVTREELVRYSRHVIAVGLSQRRILRSVVTKDGTVADLRVYDPNLAAANGAIGFLGRVVGVEDEGAAKVNLSFNLAGRLAEADE